MPVKAPVYKAPVVAPLYNWTRPYIGIAGGYGWGQTDPGIPEVGSGSYTLSGGILGGTLGYNWQQGPWVFGVLKAIIRGPTLAVTLMRVDHTLLPLSIFITWTGEPRRQSALTVAIERTVLRQLGIKLTPHQFRHLAAKIDLDAKPDA